MSGKINDIALALRTVRYLKPVQIVYQFRYRMLSYIRKCGILRPRLDIYKPGKALEFAPFIPKYDTYLGDNTFRYINITSRTEDWNCSLNGDLWRYNLNYMDFLCQRTAVCASECVRLMSDFIERAASDRVVSDPYPVSLRSVNWIKFISTHRDAVDGVNQVRFDTFLYSQLVHLMRNPEKHLMGNHLLENGFALLFGAYYFNDVRMLSAAAGILKGQLEEQVLSDGCHCELSPMYHCIMTDRVLDCINLMANNRRFEEPSAAELETLLVKSASAMLGWIKAMAPDGEKMPLFGDSAFGIAPSFDELAEYASVLGVSPAGQVLGESGYRFVKGPWYKVWADVGQTGLSYNMGHAHADSLSFVMTVKGKGFLADTGISTYNVCGRRLYERSSMAHNTVTVDNLDSSRVWASFRCAERCRVTLFEDTATRISASHDGYASLGMVHSRTFEASDRSFVIRDIISEGGCHNPVAHFHLAENVNILELTADRLVTDVATISFCGATGVSSDENTVSEEYNVFKKSVCVHVSFKDSLVSTITE